MNGDMQTFDTFKRPIILTVIMYRLYSRGETEEGVHRWVCAVDR
jgi:hypothetical protein